MKRKIDEKRSKGWRAEGRNIVKNSGGDKRSGGERKRKRRKLHNNSIPH